VGCPTKEETLTGPHSPEQPDAVVRTVEWLTKHRNQLLAGAAVIAAIVLAVWYFFAAQQRRETVADRDLESARMAAAAGNQALAASDLARLIETYGGTVAAEEGAIELARIRLTEGQPAAAMVELRKLIASGPRSQFLAPAHGLLGAALEQAGNYAEAAHEYLVAADAAWYDFLQAQYLLDAGHVLIGAGDTATAITTYERMIRDLAETDEVVEARVRLAEIEAARQPS
jgi:predicted negative regulator of RcsB-dependent stress response